MVEYWPGVQCVAIQFILSVLAVRAAVDILRMRAYEPNWLRHAGNDEEKWDIVCMINTYIRLHCVCTPKEGDSTLRMGQDYAKFSKKTHELPILGLDPLPYALYILMCHVNLEQANGS